MLRHQLGTIRLLWLLIVGSITLPLLLFGYTSWLAYSEAFREADERLQAALTIAGENAENLFRSSELILIAADQLVANLTDDEIRANEQFLHERLRVLADKLKGLNSVW